VLIAAGAYAVTRRLFVTLLVVTVLLAGASYALAPRLATERTGDPELLSQLADLRGYHQLSVATVDLRAAQPIRHARHRRRPDRPVRGRTSPKRCPESSSPTRSSAASYG
jgi:hypothetical protein